MSFAVHDLDQGEGAASVSMITADLDRDGDLDIVSQNIWRENVDGKGTFGANRPFASEDYDAKQIEAVDVDGDGDLDLVALARISIFSAYDLRFFENRDGRGDFGLPQTIDTDLEYSFSFAAGDIDNDRDVDLVLLTYDGSLPTTTMHWYENTDGRGAFSRIRQTVSSSWGRLQFLDVDTDGDLDLISQASDFENTDGKGTFQEKNLVPDEWKQVFRDAQGILNVLTNGFLHKRLSDGTFTRVQMRPCVTTNPFDVELIALNDLNGDGVLDRVTLSYLSPARDTDQAIVLWCGGGAQQEVVTLFDAYRQPVLLEDLTGDGVKDMLYGTAYRSFDLQKGRFGPEVVLMSPTWTDSVHEVKLADLDGDGDLDAVSLAISYESNQDLIQQTISWNENLDGRGTFGSRKPIGGITAGGLVVERLGTTNFFVVDVDNDQDLDVVYEDIGAGTYIEVATNVDGRGKFSSQFEKWPFEDRYKGVLWDVQPLESGGRADLLFLSAEGVSVQRATGNGKFGPLETLVRAPDLFANRLPGLLMVPLDFNVQLVDWDRDGDLDLMGVNQRYEVAWWENLNDGTQFGPRIPLFTANMDSVPYQSVGLSVADLDGDRDLDVMLAAMKCTRSCNGAATRWFANIDGHTFGPGVPISDSIRRPRVVDMDGDGDWDILGEDVSQANVFQHERLDAAWYENIGGTGTTWTRNEIAGGSQWVVATGDIDGDGDADLLAPNLKWYEQRLSGDINNDGRFSSSDLVLAFQAGLFENDVPGRAQLHQGDFNGDGSFDSADLIFAYQFGGYEKVLPLGD